MIIRHGNRRRWTTIDRGAIADARLSFRALGVLTWLLDKPDGWTGFGARTLAAGGGREGRDAVRSALRELERAGYLEREKTQDDLGRWGTVTTVYEIPPGPGSSAPGADAWNPGSGRSGPFPRTTPQN